VIGHAAIIPPSCLSVKLIARQALEAR
jgi:hypothetical protein